MFAVVFNCEPVVSPRALKLSRFRTSPLTVWLTVVTAIFLHTGIIHLLLNLSFLGAIGFTLEQRWGHIKFAALYMLTGLGGSLLSVQGESSAVSVG
jgi:membrane associated rhomboid family serine protease